MNAEARVDDRPLDAGEFAALPEEEGYRLELSLGRLVREPAPGPRHAHLVSRLAILLGRFGEEKGLGLVLTGAGFTLATGPDTVRAPDVAFVSSHRIPEERLGDRSWELAPDLAIEVVSPSDRASEIQQKALQYLDAGSRLIWIVDPAERTVTVLRSRSEIRILVPGEVLG